MKERIAIKQIIKTIRNIERLKIIENFMDIASNAWIFLMLCGWFILLTSMAMLFFTEIKTPFLSGLSLGIFLSALLLLMFKNSLIHRWLNDTD